MTKTFLYRKPVFTLSFCILFFSLLSLLTTHALMASETYMFVTKWPSQAWYFNSPSGAAIDSSGNVYVADTWNNRIQKFDSNGTFILEWGSSGTGDGQLNLPRGVAVDSLGNVYVASGGIQKFDSNGTFITAFGAFGESYGVAVDSYTGWVYASDFYNHRILKFDSDGTFITMWGAEGPGDDHFKYPSGIAVDSSGYVYVADTNNHRIQKFDPYGTSLINWGGVLGSGDGQFYFPYGVAIDSSGNVCVADTYNHRIQKFDSSGIFIAKWGTQGTGDNQFDYPFGIAAGSSGNVYVADTWNNRIQKFDSSSNFVTRWQSYGSDDGWFDSPHGIAVDSSGNIYAADTYNHRIQKFDSSGTFIAKQGSFGSGDGQFKRPRGIAVDSSGNAYVADTGNNRIQKFDLNGTFITQWGGFNEPGGVAVDSSGNVYVADTGNHRIQKFDLNGTFITQWGGFGTGNGLFRNPHGVAVDPSGYVLVADSNNYRIQKFDSTGTFITRWGVEGTGDGQFNSPRGVAVDALGNIYVADTDVHVADGISERIQKFDSNGTFITKWGSYGTDDGQFYHPEGVAVDSSGNIYVADTRNHRIQKFSLPDTTPPTVTLNPLTPDPINDVTPIFTGTATDTENSIKNVEYTLDDGTTWQQAQAVDGVFDEKEEAYAFTTDVLADGDYTVKVRATDEADKTTEQVNYATDTFAVDNTAPATTLTTNPAVPGPTGWYTSFTTISLLANETATTYYSWVSNTGPWATYSGSFGALSNNNTLYYYSEDAPGNIETVKSQVIRVDMSLPTSTISAPSDGARLGGLNYDISGTASDSLSGLSKVEISINAGPFQLAVGTSPWSFSWTLPTDGSYNIQSRATDVAGNTQVPGAGITVMVDNTIPLAPANLFANPSGWSSNNSFKLSWSNPSDFSGIAAVWYKLEFLPTSDIDGIRVAGNDINSIINITASGNGSHSVYVWLEDGAGNKDHNNRAEAVLKYDDTPPSAPTSLNASGVRLNQINLAWTASADAGGSGLAAYKIERAPDNSGSPGTFAQIATSSTNSYSDTGLTSGTKYWYRVRAYDKVNLNSDYSNIASATTLFIPPAEPTIASTWYFAEGFTGDGFHEWLCLQNPNEYSVDVTIEYMYRGGGGTTQYLTIGADTRETVDVNSVVGPGKEVSAKVTSDDFIIAERPMYFDFQGYNGGHDVVGAEGPSTTWYFAEGFTGEGFQEYLTIQNPNPGNATVTITYYYRGGGAPRITTKTIPANSRETIDVNTDAGSNQEVSIKVESTLPIVAERPMYFNFNGKSGGHTVAGATTGSTVWYFAEGYTGPGFQEYLTLQNPGAAPANVTIEYMYRGGGGTTQSITVGANTRETVDVNVAVGSGREVSAKVTSDQPIIAERPMYFDYYGVTGGHNVVGAPITYDVWYFAEGYTGPWFQEYLTLQNPNPNPTNVYIVYLSRSGWVDIQVISIGANTRETIDVNEFVGFDEEISAVVESDLPIIAERPMYFFFDGIAGGHDVCGY